MPKMQTKRSSFEIREDLWAAGGDAERHCALLGEYHGSAPTPTLADLAERFDELSDDALADAGEAAAPYLPDWAAGSRSTSPGPFLAKLDGWSVCALTPPKLEPEAAEAPWTLELATAEAPWTDRQTVKLDLPKVCKWWADRKRGRNPLSPLVKAFAALPPRVQPETRQDRRIVPAFCAGRTREAPERERGRLLGGILDGQSDAEVYLPGFEPPPRKSVALLDLWDAAGVPVMARGRGAPLSARLYVEAALAIAPADRKRQSVRVAASVGELGRALFPNQWRPARDWPRLLEALERASSYAIRLPGQYWRMIALRSWPDSPRDEGLIVLDVAFPPGGGDGPPVDLPELRSLSVDSAPRWRAYIAAHALAWRLGVTRRPHPRSGLWVWSGNPTDYPILTAADRERLAFGERTQKNRTRAEVGAAWEGLPGVEAIDRDARDPETGERGWRIVPTKAADAIRKAADRKR